MPSPLDLATNDFAKGVAIGIGIAVLVPFALAALAPALKPIARAALKAGLLAAEKGREMLAELSETVQDVAAETQMELREARLADAATELADVAESGGEPSPGSGPA